MHVTNGIRSRPGTGEIELWLQGSWLGYQKSRSSLRILGAGRKKGSKGTENGKDQLCRDKSTSMRHTKKPRFRALHEIM